MGETKEKVLKATNQARGGILFIDEAYGIAVAGSSHGSSSFGREAIDTLVVKMISEEFKGNLLFIMAGTSSRWTRCSWFMASREAW